MIFSHANIHKKCSLIYFNNLFEDYQLLTFGSLSEEGRSNGIQGDAIRNIVGSISGIMMWDCSGLYINKGSREQYLPWGEGKSLMDMSTNLQEQGYPTGSDIRVKNRLIRIYKRIA